ncbi:MAG: CrcB family protein [Actinomycetota bacterium]|nr:CrcB family protein [Actinomycetota bacterium]
MPTREPGDHERPLPLDPDIETDEGPAGEPLPVHLTWQFIVLVTFGGTGGTATRYLLDGLIGTDGGFPLATFVINLTGALILGILLEAFALRGSDVDHRRRFRLLLGTGFLGGYTTYSALAVETDTLIRSGQPWLALAYPLGTVVLGLCASIAGIALARKEFHR